ncbi:hypothetical protein PPERSA_04399 [Pseudocohnilembus persalinus]|uniref:EF-hand domain-containing protein n=1 Tax=Pseudocohnilembus persalinus TaxID=266149 RepID=A0A0V0QRE6_PSEPJ|nr:hypothetical protein PPERSA_04399 [Pseudocohnilembus persalinus]|eukprot:KRX04584.1 hypothetical protein PPERSA_04399 [Pseudocohnilembus persalinus]
MEESNQKDQTLQIQNHQPLIEEQLNIKSNLRKNKIKKFDSINALLDQEEDEKVIQFESKNNDYNSKNLYHNDTEKDEQISNNIENNKISFQTFLLCFQMMFPLLSNKDIYGIFICSDQDRDYFFGYDDFQSILEQAQSIQIQQNSKAIIKKVNQFFGVNQINCLNLIDKIDKTENIQKRQNDKKSDENCINAFQSQEINIQKQKLGENKTQSINQLEIQCPENSNSKDKIEKIEKIEKIQKSQQNQQQIQQEKQNLQQKYDKIHLNQSKSGLCDQGFQQLKTKLFSKIHLVLKRQQIDLEDAFESMDIDGDGKISFKDFYQSLKLMNIPNNLQEIQKIFNLCDKDNDKYLSLQEFSTQFGNDS